MPPLPLVPLPKRPPRRPFSGRSAGLLPLIAGVPKIVKLIRTVCAGDSTRGGVAAEDNLSSITAPDLTIFPRASLSPNARDGVAACPGSAPGQRAITHTRLTRQICRNHQRSRLDAASQPVKSAEKRNRPALPHPRAWGAARRPGVLGSKGRVPALFQLHFSPVWRTDPVKARSPCWRSPRRSGGEYCCCKPRGRRRCCPRRRGPGTSCWTKPWRDRSLRRR